MARRPTRQNILASRQYTEEVLAEELALLVTGRMPNGDPFFPAAPVSEWTLQATADNAIATVTRNAPGVGSRLYVTGISGSYSVARIGLMRLLAGAAVIASFHVHNARDVDFASPIEIAENTAVTLDLAASGTLGQIGAVVLRGFTVGA